MIREEIRVRGDFPTCDELYVFEHRFADAMFVVGVDCADGHGIESDDEPRGRVGGMPSWPFTCGKCGSIGGRF